MSQPLPIDVLLPDVISTVANHPCTVLQAEPGAGKSTQVPLALLRALLSNKEDGKIVLLEPRRLAARSLADYLAQQLGEPVGQSVGLQVRNERKRSATTRLEVITEGVLIQRLQQDPELADTAIVIFDEFHERNLETDLALTLCLESQQSLREDLKLLIMSATINSEQISTFLDNAPVIQCPGRTYPVTVHYCPPSKQQTYNALSHSIIQALNKALPLHQGNCLVFLPGQKEISQAIALASEQFDDKQFALLPLYGSLTPAAQTAVLQPDHLGRRKIIFSTNIAETSLTIEGIDCVIDRGLARKAQYDVSSGMTRMMDCKISLAAAEQRAGRAGRLQAGSAYRLWAESDCRPAFETEAILESDLTDTLLQVACWGERDPYALNWLTPPPAAHVAAAKSLLVALALLNDNGSPTALGRLAARLGLPARLAKMLLIASATHKPELQKPVCHLAALIQEQDLFKRDVQSGADCNIQHRLDALNLYEQDTKQAKQHYPLKSHLAKQLLTQSHQYLKRLAQLDTLELSETDKALAKQLESPAQLLALAYPDRIAKQRDHQRTRYQLSNGKGCQLHEHDALSQSPYLVVATLDGQRQDGRVFQALPITLNEIESAFAEQISENTEIDINADKQQLRGWTVKQLGALTLQKTTCQNLSKAQIQQGLLQTIKAQRLAPLPWNEPIEKWLARVRWLGNNNAEYAHFSEQALIDSFDDWCAPYLSHIDDWKAVQKLDLLALLQARLSYEQLQQLEKKAPEQYVTPSGKKATIVYQQDKAPFVSIPLQEVFGEQQSPVLGFGQEKLCFELLSPARRPLQITSDLANFWQSSYHEIAKEMRGRYPKHRWPEDPANEKAGHSLKKRQ